MQKLVAARPADVLAALGRLRERRAMIVDEIEEAEAELACHRPSWRPATLIPAPPGPCPTCADAACRWCCAYWPTTPSCGCPNASTPTWPDPDEVRAITRHLLQQPGTIAYTAGAVTVTVTVDRPDQPRVARALGLLADELNATPARIPGDTRPIAYRISPCNRPPAKRLHPEV